MDKKYSNCPLKKRPIYVIHEETDADIEIDDDTKPVDLSSWRIKEEKVPFEMNEESSPINYSKTRYSPKTKKIEVVKEKDYNFLPSHSWDSKDVQNPDKRCNNRYFNHQKPQSLDGYNYSRIPIPSPPRSDLNSPLEFREYSVSPVPLTGSYSEFNSSGYYCESRNYNNNLIKHEDEEIRDQEIRFSEDNQLLSPSPSHISYGSGHSDFGDYSEPEDLSVKNKRKVLVPTDSNANIQRIETGYSEKSSSDLYFQCRICNKCYSTYLGLMKHQQSHSIPQEFRSNPQYNTSVVIPGTNLRSSLANNSDKQVVSNNDTNRPFGAPRYQCKDCGKSYSTFSGLTKHQQFHCPCAEGNQTKKVFSCKNCDKVYVSLGALKMHIRTHTLPCKCPLCGKAFSRPWLLQGHIRTHTGEKPFTCQHCQRAFADRSNLRAHLQTHSEVKKYCCTSCTKTFSRMSLLTKHLQGGCCGAISASSTSNQNQIVQTQPPPREDLYYDRKGNVYHNLETVKYQNHTYETPLSNNYDRS